MCLYTSVQVTSEASQLLEIDLQEVVSYPMWMLGVELGSPGRVVNFLNCSVISPAKNGHLLFASALLKTLLRKPKA